jgi:hypothetical protein
MKRFTWLLPLLLIGCASRSVVILREAPAKPSECTIEVFDQGAELKRPYEKLCALTVKLRRGATEEKAVRELKKQACGCGADALVLGVGNVKENVFRKKLTLEATAIRWTNSAIATPEQR